MSYRSCARFLLPSTFQETSHANVPSSRASGAFGCYVTVIGEATTVRYSEASSCAAGQLQRPGAGPLLGDSVCGGGALGVSVGYLLPCLEVIIFVVLLVAAIFLASHV